MPEGSRYAVYYAPDRDSPLDLLGRGWLGRNVHTGEAVSPPALPDLAPERWREITADARGYGFHGTLKPPFHLAEGCSADELSAAALAFARRRAPFTLPTLSLAAISGFLALVPSLRSAELHDLADDCVRAFDGFRAPPAAAELARRRQARLSQRQESLLATWGYPYVMDQFRFHLTLTCRLEDSERAAVAGMLRPLVAPFCADPVPVEAIWIFHQPAPGEPFRAIRRCPFEG